MFSELGQIIGHVRSRDWIGIQPSEFTLGLGELNRLFTLLGFEGLLAQPLI